MHNIIYIWVTTLLKNMNKKNDEKVENVDLILKSTCLLFRKCIRN